MQEQTGDAEFVGPERAVISPRVPPPNNTGTPFARMISSGLAHNSKEIYPNILLLIKEGKP
jgi:hypothetical protein